MRPRRSEGLRQLLSCPPLGVKIVLFLLGTVCYAAAGYIFFERPGKPETTWLDGFWWAIVTMTTVGYGDHFPVTAAGRFLIAYPTMLIGMGFMAFGLTQLVSFLLHAETLNRKGLMMSRDSNHVIVCNFPSRVRFRDVLAELRAQPDLAKKTVVVVDEALEELDDAFASSNVHYTRGNPSHEETLGRAGIAGAISAVVLARDPTDPDSDNATVATCLTLKTLRPDLHIVAECVNRENEEVLLRAGCASAVCVTSLAPGMLAQEIQARGIVAVIQELTIWEEEKNNLYILPIISRSSVEKTVADLWRWAEDEGVTVLGVQSGEQTLLNPARARVIEKGDAAILVSKRRPTQLALS